jgi:hypothetical protein
MGGAEAPGKGRYGKSGRLATSRTLAIVIHSFRLCLAIAELLRDKL